jgi:hypothetical protein
MKALLIFAALSSSFTVAWAQNPTADELRLIRREMEVLRQEQEAEAQRSAERQRQNEMDALMESSRRRTALSQEQAAMETQTKQQQLSATLDTLEAAQAARLLSEAEVRWLTNRISDVREQYRSISKSEMGFRSKEMFYKRIWEMPLFDRMVLIHSREKERWAQASPPPTEPEIVEEAIPITPETNFKSTPQSNTGGTVNARKRALMQQMVR